MQIYLNRNEIRELNQRLAGEIEKAYPPGTEVTVVVTLKGALFFAADLLRELKLSVQLDFVRLASYGSSTKSSGEVRLLKDLDTAIGGKHVLVLDEIVDSGRSLNFLRTHLSGKQPASIKLCALLDKPSRREVEVTVDFVGRQVEDRFLVGYGLDHAEKHRNLADVYALD